MYISEQLHKKFAKEDYNTKNKAFNVSVKLCYLQQQKSSIVFILLYFLKMLIHIVPSATLQLNDLNVFS